jgi:hypothetical protein
MVGHFFYTAVTVVGFGSLLVLIIEMLRDWFFKRREEYETIKKYSVLYSIINQRLEFGLESDRDKAQIMSVLCIICVMLYFRHEITRK